jgi:hypothetical protein
MGEDGDLIGFSMGFSGISQVFFLGLHIDLTGFSMGFHGDFHGMLMI